jgi:outer membrane receptor protein involved in Fe transport
MYQHSTDRGAARSLYNPPAGSSGQVIDGIANEPIDSKNAIVSLNVQYDFDNFSIVSETAYHKRDNSLNGINYYYVPVISFAVAGANGYIQGPTYDGNPTNSDIYTEELRFSSKGSGPFKWTFGTFLLRSKSFLAGYEYAPALIPFIGGDTVVNRNDHHTQDETAGFAEATYTVAGKLDLTAGVRASHSTLDDKIFSAGYVPVKSANPAVFVKTAFTENDNPVTEHFSATYRWTPDFNLYVAAARGFRVGGINQASGRPGNISPPTYAADSLWNYEAGAKGNLFNGKFIYSADIYYIDWHNMQINVQNALGNYTSNAGDGGLYGFEGQFDAKLTEALRVGGGLTISHNRISTETSGISTPTGLRTLHKGDLLPASPERQASVYVERSFQIGEHSAYIRGSANYVGKEWVGFAKTGPSFGNYTVADLRAGVFIRSVEASLYVSNLFDRDGLLSASLASKSGPVIVANLDAIRLRPRTVGLTLRTSF